MDEIIAAYQAGVGSKELGRCHGVTGGTILRRLRAADVQVRRQGDRGLVLPDAEIEARYLAGESCEAIAADCRVNASTVAARLRGRGVTLRQGGPLVADFDLDAAWRAYEAGASAEAVGARFGVSAQTITRRFRAAGREMRPVGSRPNGSSRRVDLPVREVVLRYGIGWSIEDLAEAYGCSAPTVRARLVDAGVTIRPARRPRTAA